MNSQYPSPNQDENKPSVEPAFFSKIEEEAKVQNQHIKEIENRIAALNAERAKVNETFGELKKARILTRKFQKSLTELKDTLAANIKVYEKYLKQIQKQSLDTLLGPILSELKNQYQEQSALGQEIQQAVAKNETEKEKCTQIETLLSELLAEQEEKQIINASPASLPVSPLSEAIELENVRIINSASFLEEENTHPSLADEQDSLASTDEEKSTPD